MKIDVKLLVNVYMIWFVKNFSIEEENSSYSSNCENHCTQLSYVVGKRKVENQKRWSKKLNKSIPAQFNQL